MFVRLLLIVVGVFVALAGHQEYRLVSQASAEPRFVELSELEAGGIASRRPRPARPSSEALGRACLLVAVEGGSARGSR